MKNRSWTLTAKVETEGAETEGVIMGFGGVAAGMVLYLDGGVPVFDYNLFEEHTVVQASKPLPAGEAEITLDFAYLGAEGEAGKGAEINLSVNGTEVATGSMESTVAGRFGIDTFGIGEDSGQPVTAAYKPPFKFTGGIESVVVEVR